MGSIDGLYLIPKPGVKRKSYKERMIDKIKVNLEQAFTEGNVVGKKGAERMNRRDSLQSDMKTYSEEIQNIDTRLAKATKSGVELDIFNKLIDGIGEVEDFLEEINRCLLHEKTQLTIRTIIVKHLQFKKKMTLLGELYENAKLEYNQFNNRFSGGDDHEVAA